MKAQLNTVKAQLNTLKAQLNTLKAQLNTLKAQLNSLKVQLNSMKAQLNTLKACISEMREELCIFALIMAASTDVPSLASTFSCSHSMSSVMGVGSCMYVTDKQTDRQYIDLTNTYNIKVYHISVLLHSNYTVDMFQS